jgi:hypothetical protein
VPVQNIAAEHFIAELAGRLGYTGSLAFDFIEDRTGNVWVIECNPRLTSGIHLLAPDTSLTAAFERNIEHVKLEPAEIRAAVMLARPRLAGRSRDVVFSKADPGPALFQLAGVVEMAVAAARYRVPLLAAATRDIEFNGS